ncbi:hypothetical protein [Amycolatopsis sp. NPDC059021]|uniref:hypothetical protein n=1 Tax=Amycolatopsis sp. NPDC059021 TaxID=3346704 RepID=UPI00366CA1F0
MRFTCEQHPGLIVHDVNVTFVDGEAEVDARTAAELRKLPAELGVLEADAASSTKTRRSRSE